jgi:hypothetical protein
MKRVFSLETFFLLLIIKSKKNYLNHQLNLKIIIINELSETLISNNCGDKRCQ